MCCFYFSWLRFFKLSLEIREGTHSKAQGSFNGHGDFRVVVDGGDVTQHGVVHHLQVGGTLDLRDELHQLNVLVWK